MISFANASCVFVYWLAMVMLLLAMLVTIKSFSVSGAALSFAVETIYECLGGNDRDILRRPNPWNAKVHFYSRLRAYFFFSGLLLLGSFLIVNGVRHHYLQQSHAMERSMPVTVEVHDKIRMSVSISPALLAGKSAHMTVEPAGEDRPSSQK